MADAPGAVISSLASLSEESPHTILALAHLLTVEATGGAVVRVRITNASTGPLRWTPAGRDPARLEPGEAFEVTIDRCDDFAGMQLIAGEAVAMTLTVTVCEGASRQHLLAQALVSR